MVSDEIKAGDNYYIPGGRTKKEHKKLRKRLVKKYNFNVLVINGNGWKLHRDGYKTKIIGYRDLSISDRIADMYERYDLKDKPFAITGQLCIERGVTLTSEGFQLTHGIFSHKYEINEDIAYQTVGRLTGNNKQYLKKTPKIYCTRRFKQIVLHCEKDAMDCN